MKITNIRFAKLCIPLITPFKTALRTVNNIEDIIVIIETDVGEIGYGSAPSTPVITGDTHSSIVSAIDTIIKPKILGCQIVNINEITQLIQTALVNNYSAKAAVEIAVYDLWGKYHSAPLYKLLGGGKNNLKTDITISVDGIDKMVADSLNAITDGFDILKIKIGNDIHQDIKRVQAIHDAVGQKAQLRLDVNQGWTKKQTVYAANIIENSGV
jgi:L-alanine-DL-glutamate epimerase-like enolase superfamily enzyme